MGDCIAEMARLPDKSVDMIFADPPYNLQLGGDLFDPKAVGSMPSMTTGTSSTASPPTTISPANGSPRRAASSRTNGTIWVIGSYHNIFRVGTLLQDAEFWILNDVIWRKANPMPNFRGTRFTNAHETLIWCAKDEKARYTFNYRAMKALNDDLQMRLTGSCRSAVDRSGRRTKMASRRIRRRSRKRCSTASCSLARSRAMSCSIHSSAPGRARARRLGRRWIGIEREPSYVQVAKQRIASTLPLDESAMQVVPDKRSARASPSACS